MPPSYIPDWIKHLMTLVNFLKGKSILLSLHRCELFQIPNPRFIIIRAGIFWKDPTIYQVHSVVGKSRLWIDLVPSWRSHFFQLKRCQSSDIRITLSRTVPRITHYTILTWIQHFCKEFCAWLLPYSVMRN